jgi:mannose-6-phosphate isomerase-like protein (cupin superfamily)
MSDYLASVAGPSNANFVTYNAAGDGWGVVLLEPATAGAWQAVGRQHYICYVSAGEVTVAFGDSYAVEPEELTVKEGSFWEVQRGNSFRPRNTSSKRPAIFVYMKVSSPSAA